MRDDPTPDELILAQMETAELRRQLELLERREIRLHARAQQFLEEPSKSHYFVGTAEEDADDDELATFEVLPPSDWWRRDDES